jgi:hypothetical protein
MMASLPSSVSTPVDWAITHVSISQFTFPIARLEVPLFLGAPPSSPHSPRDLCWLDTGAPLSVVPWFVHHQRLAWQPLPGVRTTWAGQPCDVGRIDVWLPTTTAPHLRGPFSLLAKFPQSDPPGDLVPVLLGLEFFLANRLELEMLLPPLQALIRLP